MSAELGFPMKNAMTVDVEDYFHVSAFARSINRESWVSQQSRVRESNHLQVAAVVGPRQILLERAHVAHEVKGRLSRHIRVRRLGEFHEVTVELPQPRQHELGGIVALVAALGPQRGLDSPAGSDQVRMALPDLLDHDVATVIDPRRPMLDQLESARVNSGTEVEHTALQFCEMPAQGLDQLRSQVAAVVNLGQ